jgi:predicted amidophosphoribosyltransferase
MLRMLLQIIAPVRCLCCQKNATLCCPEHLYEPGIELIEGLVVHYLFPLDETRTAVMTAFKDEGVTALAKVFASSAGQLLATAQLAYSVTLVIPPRNKSNYRKRGYHPVEMVANNLGSRVVRAKASKSISDQRGLDAKDRARNLDHAFELENLEGKQVLLFDDVLTTGATLRELKRAAEDAGAQVMAGCVLARRFADFDKANLKKA